MNKSTEVILDKLEAFLLEGTGDVKEFYESLPNRELVLFLIECASVNDDETVKMIENILKRRKTND